ncbi:MAG: hypothetical protein V1695_02080 [Candidatus Uhrbacteria bacterium]
MSEISHSIYRTVAYFSLFDYPLTTFEIWKWLFGSENKTSLLDVRRELVSSGFLSERIVGQGGFWTPTGQPIEELIKTRHERYLNAVRKYKRLRWATGYLSLIPSVRGVAACNTLAWNHTRGESDIDIFVIVREGSVWTSRLLAVAPFKILKMRPGTGKRDPLCFTFFLSDTNLDLSALQLEGSDPYLAVWARSLVPIFDRDNVFDQFVQANGWLATNLPNSYQSSEHHHRRVDSDRSSWRAPNIFERLAERLQRRKFPEVIQNMANRDSRVVVSDAMLKFHDNDRRAEYRDKLETIVSEVVQ